MSEVESPRPESLEARWRRATGEAQRQGLESFQSWFDTADDLEASRIQGQWDMAFHILTPTVCRYLSEPHKKTALEIGYGGGRLLGPACRFFGTVLGVDIHNETETVQAYLEERGHKNFRLLSTEGASIGLPAASVDFIYSFIVLQHLSGVGVLRAYIQEAARCLRRGGVTQLFMGRPSHYLRSPWERLACLWRGYAEIPVEDPALVSLVVEPYCMRRLCRESGLRVVGQGRSYRRIPDGYPLRPGGQFFLTAVKEGEG